MCVCVCVHSLTHSDGVILHWLDEKLANEQVNAFADDECQFINHVLIYAVN